MRAGFPRFGRASAPRSGQSEMRRTVLEDWSRAWLAEWRPGLAADRTRTRHADKELLCSQCVRRVSGICALWSGGRRNSNCCFDAGRRQRAAKAKQCGSGGSSPMSTSLRGRLPKHFCVALNAERGRRSAFVTLRARLKPLAPGLTPRAVPDKLAAIQMLDVHFPTTDGRTLILSRYTELNADQKIRSNNSGSTCLPSRHRASPHRQTRGRRKSIDVVETLGGAPLILFTFFFELVKLGAYEHLLCPIDARITRSSGPKPRCQSFGSSSTSITAARISARTSPPQSGGSVSYLF